MTLRVAINGFGRIGRAFYRLSHDRDDVEVVAINDLTDVETAAYLLQYDSVYGKAPFKVEAQTSEPHALIVDGTSIPYSAIKNPAELPWAEMNIDVVIESTGVFTDYAKASAHLEAGARHVVISAPVKGDAPEGVSGATALMGVNDDVLSNVNISSNASCTTNAGAGVIAVLHKALGIEKAMLNTVHAYTSTQSLVDGPNKKVRRGRAAAQNIVPSSTGAAIATTQVIPDLEGKFDGVALRVPVVAGSIADITFLASRDTTAEEVNDILTKASAEEHWAGIFSVTDDPIVSSDIVGSTYAGIVDLEMTRVVDGNLVKVMVWYDNEMGYTNTLLQHVVKVGEKQ